MIDRVVCAVLLALALATVGESRYLTADGNIRRTAEDGRPLDPPLTPWVPRKRGLGRIAEHQPRHVHLAYGREYFGFNL